MSAIAHRPGERTCDLIRDGLVCVFRSKSDGHSDFMSDHDSDLMWDIRI